MTDGKTPGFAEIWFMYPRKRAKVAAEKAYLKAVTVRKIPHKAIIASLEIMKATEWRGRAPEYIPHMASWINREAFNTDCRESFEIDSQERTEALEDDSPAICVLFCKECFPPHEWTCSDPMHFHPSHIFGCPVSRKNEVLV